MVNLKWPDQNWAGHVGRQKRTKPQRVPTTNLCFVIDSFNRWFTRIPVTNDRTVDRITGRNLQNYAQSAEAAAEAEGQRTMPYIKRNRNHGLYFHSSPPKGKEKERLKLNWIYRALAKLFLLFFLSWIDAKGNSYLLGMKFLNNIIFSFTS